METRERERERHLGDPPKNRGSENSQKAPKQNKRTDSHDLPELGFNGFLLACSFRCRLPFAVFAVRHLFWP